MKTETEFLQMVKTLCLTNASITLLLKEKAKQEIVKNALKEVTTTNEEMASLINQRIEWLRLPQGTKTNWG